MTRAKSAQLLKSRLKWERLGLAFMLRDEGVVLLRRWSQSGRRRCAARRRRRPTGSSRRGETAGGQVVAEGLQMGFAIAFAQARDHFAIHMVGNFGGIFDGIEVGDQRDGDPIVAVDSLVAGNDGAQLAGLAAAQLTVSRRRLARSRLRCGRWD